MDPNTSPICQLNYFKLVNDNYKIHFDQPSLFLFFFVWFILCNIASLIILLTRFPLWLSLAFIFSKKKKHFQKLQRQCFMLISLKCLLMEYLVFKIKSRNYFSEMFPTSRDTDGIRIFEKTRIYHFTQVHA